ncbi:MAG: GatB/YqeY domain-containing protein [Alphaproteobacteria bacterium]|nr:MAG: GatB/YqeY domain-containing protein [Alphaproteobacteria bacterium]
MLREQMNEALKDAMRSGQTRKVATVRLMIAKLRDKDIESRPKGIDQIPDGEILSMLQGMIKQRRDSIEMYRQGKRDDLVEQELQEITVIEAFLPQALDEAASRAAIAQIIGQTGAMGVKDMGKVMAAIKTDYAGQMDMTKASGWVKEALASCS